MNFIRCLARIIGALVLLVGLSGCSAVKLGYANAPSLTYWWLNDYVGFSDGQAPQVRSALERLHQWHRQTELPRYANLLQQMETLASADVTAAQVCVFAANIRDRFSALTAQALPDIAAIAMTLNADQLAQLERRYARDDADLHQKWMGPKPEERDSRRLKQWIERSEMIYGALDDTQRDWLRQEMTQSAQDASSALQDRKRRHQAIVQTLRAITGADVTPTQAQRIMAIYLKQAQTPANPEQAQQTALRLQAGCQTFAGLHNRTTPLQRDMAIKRLRAYQRDIRELASVR